MLQEWWVQLEKPANRDEMFVTVLERTFELAQSLCRMSPPLVLHWDIILNSNNVVKSEPPRKINTEYPHLYVEAKSWWNRIIENPVAQRVNMGESN